MRKMLATAAVVLLFALGASSAGAGIDEGGAANKRGDHATAVQKWRALAERDNATAQFILGFMYTKGQSVQRDYTEAVRWYRKAAEQGHAKAQQYLGFMYG